MLDENIRLLRKQKGLSQEELAVKLNVVRQTVSKWENGNSVPDSHMLIKLAEVLDTEVSVLIGEKVGEAEPDEIKTIAEKLEVINCQLAQRAAIKKKHVSIAIVLFCLLLILIFIGLYALGSPYLSWDYSDPELAVTGVLMHGFEWIFVRTAPVLLIGALAFLIIYNRRN